MRSIGTMKESPRESWITSAAKRQGSRDRLYPAECSSGSKSTCRGDPGPPASDLNSQREGSAASLPAGPNPSLSADNQGGRSLVREVRARIDSKEGHCRNELDERRVPVVKRAALAYAPN